MPGISRHRRGASSLLVVTVPVCMTACSLVANFDGLVGERANEATPSSDATAAADGFTQATDASNDGAVAIDSGDSGRLPDGGCLPPRGGPSCDYRQVYGLNLPTTDGWTAASDVPYDVNNAATVGAFTRVAYRLILDSHEAWVEMDAFTADATTLGIPFDTVYDKDVTNMRVTSTDPNQPTLLTPVAGHVQIWANCYGQNPTTMSYDGADVCTDSMPHCYGTMQLDAAGKSALSFHHFAGQDPGDVTDVGIGPCSDVKHSDWTFAANSPKFAQRRLEIYVK